MTRLILKLLLIDTDDFRFSDFQINLTVSSGSEINFPSGSKITGNQDMLEKLWY